MNDSGAAMEEIKSASAGSEPRWKTAGEPYLLTRDELLEILHQRGIMVTDRQIKSWVTYGLIPSPIRRVRPGTTDGRPYALFPLWTAGLVMDLVVRMNRGSTIEYLKNKAVPFLWDHWEQREHIFFTDVAPEQAEDPDVRRRVMGALMRAVRNYTEYLTNVNGRLVAHADLWLYFEDATSEVFHLPTYSPKKPSD